MTNDKFTPRFHLVKMMYVQYYPYGHHCFFKGCHSFGMDHKFIIVSMTHIVTHKRYIQVVFNKTVRASEASGASGAGGPVKANCTNITKRD